VLENVVGKDFLPRGSGIVTRRPLVLQLIQVPGGEDGREWGEFLHKPGKEFTSFDEIRAEIEAETDRLTGSNKGISNKPINLKVFSPRVISLTLVDLPGMTRVPVGDQPADIEAQIRGMIMTYISKPTTIILAVSAANQDLATSDALMLAREVDPDGHRTLGVLTKIDIMDKGTNAMDALLGKVVPLQLGFVGVVNRSQGDIDGKLSIRDALKAESQFFSSHPLYRTIASRCGTPFLANTLNRILVNHIRESLPALKARISKLLNEAEAEMATYGQGLPEGTQSRGAALLHIITKFSNDFSSAVDGSLSSSLATHELYGGARINFIFQEIFARCLADANPLAGLTIDDVKTTIRNAAGLKSALFVPERSFELLAKRQIARLEPPSLQCVDLIYDELTRIVSVIDFPELARYASLRRRIVTVVTGLMRDLLGPTRVMIENLIRVELAFVNTAHPDFEGGDGALAKVMRSMAEKREAKEPKKVTEGGEKGAGGASEGKGSRSSRANPFNDGKDGQQPKHQLAAADEKGEGEGGFLSAFFGGGKSKRNTSTTPDAPVSSSSSVAAPSRSAGSGSNAPPPKLRNVPQSIKPGSNLTEKERFETELITTLLVSYYDLVRKNIVDLVPKSIMHFLVNAARTRMQNELVAALYKDELMSELLEENPAVASRRKACGDMIRVLREASSIVAEVREFSLAEQR
jgi:dynamin 1-like protein